MFVNEIDGDLTTVAYRLDEPWSKQAPHAVINGWPDAYSNGWGEPLCEGTLDRCGLLFLEI